MTALLEQATIDERQNTIAHLPLMGRTEHAPRRGGSRSKRSGAGYEDGSCRFLKRMSNRPSLA